MTLIDARVPKVGDVVTIGVTCGSSILNFNGTIAEIGNEFLALQIGGNTTIYPEGAIDKQPRIINFGTPDLAHAVAIGIGSISYIAWV